MKHLALMIALILGSVAARAGTVFDQPLSGSGRLAASSWVDPDSSDSDMFAYDNFTLASDASVNEVHWYGGYGYGAPYGKAWNFTITFYPTILAGTEPDVLHPITHFRSGNNCHETFYGSFGGTDLYSYKFTLPKTVGFKAGKKYWIQIEASQNGYPDWGLGDASGGEGQHFVFSYGAARYYFLTGDTAFSLLTPDASQYTIAASVDPAICGTATGSGTYPVNSTVHVVATPNTGYKFVNWTEDGVVVSTSTSYSFQATSNRTLVANMVANLALFTISPTKPVGGTSPTGTLTLSVPAPVDTPVDISSSMPAGVGVPTPVWIPAGQRQATFTMSTYPWSSDYQVWITAALGPVSKTVSVIVKAPAPSTVAIQPASVTGGATAKLTVTLNGVAPNPGYQVYLSSNNAAASVPTYLSFSPGATTASCDITTSAVQSDTAATISATANGVTKSKPMTVKAAVLISLSSSPASVVGGTSATLTAKLNGPAASPGDQVFLTSSDPAVTVPAFLTVPTGSASGSCTITTTPVAVDTLVTLSGTTHGITKTKSFTVKAPSPSSVGLSPSTVTGGATSTLTVNLNGPAPAGGYTVNLSSSDPAAQVPATLTFAAGSKKATCTVTTSTVGAITSATITASANGLSRSKVLTINP